MAPPANNSSTVGFKKTRADFQDLFYQNVRFAGTQTSSQTMSPTGLQIGSGVQLTEQMALARRDVVQRLPLRTEHVVAEERTPPFPLGLRQMPQGEHGQTQGGQVQVVGPARRGERSPPVVHQQVHHCTTF